MLPYMAYIDPMGKNILKKTKGQKNTFSMEKNSEELCFLGKDRCKNLCWVAF